MVLALSLPVVRPLVLYPNHGDFLATTLFGLTLVAPLSGSSPLRGILAALLGWLVAHTGLDPHEGAERRTFGQLYLWDGVPVAILFLGIFGVSELALIALRGRVQMTAALPEPGGLRRGGDLSPGGRSAFRGDCRVAGAVGSAPAPLRPEGGWASALIFGSGRSSRDLALRSSRRGVWPGRQPLSLP